MAMRFYVWVRTDLASMNAGRVAAQVSHATSMMTAAARHTKEFKEWEKQAGTFGTTIVLDGGDLSDFPEWNFNLPEHRPTGIVVDPEYPLKDGAFVHILKDIPTCVWTLFDPEEDPPLREFIQGYDLYG